MRQLFTYGWPSAAGARTRPTSPATATIVARYGSIARNWLGIELPMTPRNPASAVVNPNSSAASVAPTGLHRPKISAARAMKPRPLVMLLLKLPTAPIVRNAPPTPATTPASSTLRYRVQITLMPTVSAAVGCSPTARVRRPHLVRKSATWISTTSTMARYPKTLDWNTAGPRIGIWDSPGIRQTGKTGG